MKRIKVLHVLNELKFSGAEIMYFSAAEEFQAYGCDLYVLSTADNIGEFSTYFTRADYKVFHWPYNTNNIIGIIKYILMVINFIKKEDIDIIHIHRSDIKLLMSFCAWFTGRKSVYTFHNVFGSRRFTYLYHILLRFVIKHFFNCKFQTISDSVYLNEKKKYLNSTTKIYNWYDPKRFFPAETDEKKQIRREIGISEDTFLIISIGGCSDIKNHKDMINALSLIIKKIPNTVYLHLGEGSTLNQEILLSNEKGLVNNILFLGNHFNVRKFLVASDLYVMTSKFEGISLTTIEAMACNIPCVLYDVPGLKDFNTELECSILSKDNHEHLYMCIVNLYNDKLKRNEIVENANYLINQKFSLVKNVKKIYELYLCP